MLWILIWLGRYPGTGRSGSRSKIAKWPKEKNITVIIRKFLGLNIYILSTFCNENPVYDLDTNPGFRVLLKYASRPGVIKSRSELTKSKNYFPLQQEFSTDNNFCVIIRVYGNLTSQGQCAKRRNVQSGNDYSMHRRQTLLSYVPDGPPPLPLMHLQKNALVYKALLIAITFLKVQYPVSTPHPHIG